MVAALVLSMPLAEADDSSTAASPGSDTDSDVASNVPPGDKWFCFYGKDGVGRCLRSAAVCKRLSKTALAPGEKPPSCFASPRAAAFTFRDVVQGTRTHEAFLKMSDCSAERKRLRGPDVEELSPCAVVGATTGIPFEPDLMPDGSGWHCLTVRGGGGFAISSCKRTKTECSEREKGAKEDGEPILSRCKKQSFAYATMSADSFWVYSSEKDCRDNLAYATRVSPCTRVH
jgi:hypothetical protein